MGICGIIRLPPAGRAAKAARQGTGVCKNMKILLVMDQFDTANNGTTVSAQRFAQALQRRGNEVRVATAGQAGEGRYVMPALWFPAPAAKLIHSQGMQLAKPDKALLRQAIAWADVVHFLMPFALSRAGLRIAEELGVPHTAAFHVQPENITYSIGLGKRRAANELLYCELRGHFYNRFSHVHCPSSFIAGELRKHGYTAQLHVISNGVDPSFCYRRSEKAPQFAGRKVLLMIGRLSAEKRQDVLIDAVARSRYSGEIQLVLAGQGPKEAALRRQGEKLPHPPIIGFYTQQELQQILSMTDLYVHASDAEIEAISCIEAFSTGVVPVIADSPLSATPQFALTPYSLFPAGSAAALAGRIDYWLARPAERQAMGLRYAQAGKAYGLDACVAQAEQMFQLAIDEQRRGAVV